MMFNTLAVLSLASSVFAHGYMNQIRIDGTTFKGPDVSNGEKNPQSAIRIVDSIEPTKGAKNPNINCGPDSKRSNLVAQAQPGSSVDVFWLAGNNQRWPHDSGPMLTYLAKCDGDCAQFDATKAKWFKINQAGLAPGGDGSTWLQKTTLMNGKPDSFKLPKNLAAGGYILRHEIIALHLADKKGGAEFYPACAQIQVGGSETGAPQSNELVSLPGAYTDTDPGILINIFNGPVKNYPFPGPKVSSLAATSNDDGTAPSSSPSSSTSSSASSAKPSVKPPGSSIQPSGATSSKSSKCSLKKSDTSKAKKRHYPRRVSRVMRNLVDIKLGH